MNMCKVVTKRGAGNPKSCGENIHLLYTDNMVANRYLAEPSVTHAEQERPGTHHEAIKSAFITAFLHQSRFFSSSVAKWTARVSCNGSLSSVGS